MEQNQNPRDEAYQNLREAKSEKRTSYAKSIGWSMVPVAVFGGLGAVISLISSPIESNDLRYMVKIGLSVAGGIAIVASGMVNDYIEQFRDLIDDVRCASQRVRDCRTRVKTLETIE